MHFIRIIQILLPHKVFLEFCVFLDKPSQMAQGPLYMGTQHETVFLLEFLLNVCVCMCVCCVCVHVCVYICVCVLCVCMCVCVVCVHVCVLCVCCVCMCMSVCCVCVHVCVLCVCARILKSVCVCPIAKQKPEKVPTNILLWGTGDLNGSVLSFLIPLCVRVCVCPKKSADKHYTAGNRGLLYMSLYAHFSAGVCVRAHVCVCVSMCTCRHV